MADLERARDTAQKILDNVKKVIIGKDESVELALVALLCQGHILIEDVPGVGKTMLARSLAKSINCDFHRIQFTPDLLPSDITGVSIYNQKTQDFEFKSGPIISQLVLADEINRATPKTQSALLEAMEELQVTVEGVTHQVPRPFIVMATQNPIEYEGTFPLPEAQLDRFLLRITLGYPSREQEMDIMRGQEVVHPIETIEPVADANQILDIQSAVKSVFVDDLIRQYIVTVTNATRGNADLSLGSSPRGSLVLFRGAQALSLIRGRDFVLPDDVKALAVPILSHRIIVASAARMRGVTGSDVVNQIIEQTPVPGAETAGWFTR